MSAETRTAPVEAAVEAVDRQILTAENMPEQSLRQASVLILLEPGREARIIPMCDDESQESALAPLLERARRMMEVDAEEQGR